jgi:putative transposase
VKRILTELGIIVTHESIRQWCPRFGTDFARKTHRRRPRSSDNWHLDGVFQRINDMLHYLWRAVDQHGVVLDILVQDRRNAATAKRFFKRLLAGLRYKPRHILTDGLRSYGMARREALPKVRHWTSRYLNNRAEDSHWPTQRRAYQMQRFKLRDQAQRFLSSHAFFYGHFPPRQHLMSPSSSRPRQGFPELVPDRRVTLTASGRASNFGSAPDNWPMLVLVLAATGRATHPGRSSRSC